MTLQTDKRDDLLWYALRSKIQEGQIKKAFAIFRENGIEPILIKGWAAAQNYPQICDRIYSDIDLCVEPAQMEKAQLLAEKQEVKKLNIDLHEGLRHFDKTRWQDLFENSRLIKIDDSEIRVLSPEDHLRVLCVHWLTDGGAYKESLMDIYFAVKNRPETFDWDRCLEIIGKKRRKWIVSTIGLTAKYLDLDLKGTPVEVEAQELPKWLIRAVEKEWRSDVKLKPLQMCLNDRSEFIRQVWKRLPPNPVQATIELEGSFDNKPRIYYQIGTIFRRIIPSIRRITNVLVKRA